MSAVYHIFQPLPGRFLFGKERSRRDAIPAKARFPRLERTIPYPRKAVGACESKISPYKKEIEMKRMTRIHLVNVYTKFLTCLIMMLGLTTVAIADAATDWNQRAVTFSSGGGRPGPTWVLDVAVVQLAVYDAVQAIEGEYQPYCGSISGASGSTAAAAAKAARDVLVVRFPGQTAAINANYNTYVAGMDPNDPGFGVGAAAAQCILDLRENDGSFPSGWPPYMGGTGIGQWRPAASGPFTFSWLPDVAPFTMRSADQFRADAPPKLTSPEYTRAYNEVKDYGSLENSLRLPEQTELANFWNGSFPGQFNKLARDLAISQGLTISQSSRLLALVGVSMADSAITAWDCKVLYNFWRPLTAIQFGDADGNPKTEGDTAWTPFVATPPYSDHTSGANNFSGSTTRAMSLFFGANEMEFQIATTNPGPTQNDIRLYSTFSEVRDEVEEARILQGIHFRFADSEGRRQGEHIAEWAHAHFFRPVNDGILFEADTSGLEKFLYR
jgi:hypothetical protein